MRCSPDGAAGAYEDGLGRFVADPELPGDGVREVAVCLHGDQRVADVVLCLGDGFGEVGAELIERFGADATAVTVLENQERAVDRFGQETVELGELVDRGQIRVHLTQCNKRVRPATAVALVALLAGVPGSVTLGAHEAGVSAGAPSVWDLAAMALLAAAGGLYALGSVRLARRGGRVRRIERAAFWAGWVTLFAAVAPPLDRLAAELFSMHMIQHKLLMLVGAPLLIVGRPIVPWLWALPARLRPAAGGGLQHGAVAATWRLLTRPLVAWAVYGAVIWIWHLPALYEAAVAHEGIHAVQHATFVASAVLFWWGLVYGRYGRAAYGASMLYVFTTMMHTGLLGALFALSGTPFYPLYEERALAAGIDPVRDQQLAGLYMWVPGSLVLMLFGLALTLAWLSEAERRSAALSDR